MTITNILFLGDLIGSPGRNVVAHFLPQVKKEHDIHFVIANGENSAHGFGVTARVYQELTEELGIDVLSGGNHIFDRKEFLPEWDKSPRVLRPVNYPAVNPGKGTCVFTASNAVKVGVVNLMGRVFMGTFDDPFTLGKKAIEEVKKETSVIVVDVHAETTSEKAALGYHFDGDVSLVVGTHTHVQTADERILPNGTAFLTDAGMNGGHDSVIGMKVPQVLQRFLTQQHIKFEPAEGVLQFNGVVVSVDSETGKAVKIERVQRILK